MPISLMALLNGFYYYTTFSFEKGVIACIKDDNFIFEIALFNISLSI